MTTLRIIIGNDDYEYLHQVLELFDYKVESGVPSMGGTRIITLKTDRILDKDSVSMDAYTIGYFVNKFKTSQCTK